MRSAGAEVEVAGVEAAGTVVAVGMAVAGMVVTGAMGMVMDGEAGAGVVQR